MRKQSPYSCYVLLRPDDAILRELAELHVVVTQESMPETKKRKEKKKTAAAFLTFNQKHGDLFEERRRNLKLQMASRRVAVRMSEAAVYRLQPSGSQRT